jgi:hypothetical protein
MLQAVDMLGLYHLGPLDQNPNEYPVCKTGYGATSTKAAA